MLLGRPSTKHSVGAFDRSNLECLCCENPNGPELSPAHAAALKYTCILNATSNHSTRESRTNNCLHTIYTHSTTPHTANDFRMVSVCRVLKPPYGLECGGLMIGCKQLTTQNAHREQTARCENNHIHSHTLFAATGGIRTSPAGIQAVCGADTGTGHPGSVRFDVGGGERERSPQTRTLWSPTDWMGIIELNCFTTSFDGGDWRPFC